MPPSEPRRETRPTPRATKFQSTSHPGAGTADAFLKEQLHPEAFEQAAQGRLDVTLRMQEGYDHSYFFIACVPGAGLLGLSTDALLLLPCSVFPCVGWGWVGGVCMQSQLGGRPTLCPLPGTPTAARLWKTTWSFMPSTCMLDPGTSLLLGRPTALHETLNLVREACPCAGPGSPPVPQCAVPIF